jgi:hypothetical protein
VLAAEHLLDLSAFDLALQRVECTFEVCGDIFTLLGPLEQDAQVVDLAGEGVP